jgi:CO dehydrogenase maturation factor
MDMEAGLEHLGRGTARHVDALIAVVAPHHSSARTVLRIRDLAVDVGLRKLVVIANRIRTPEDRLLVETALSGLPIVAELPQYENLDSDSTHEGPDGRRLLADLAAQLPALEAACCSTDG